jgi:hypothetical protein
MRRTDMAKKKNSNLGIIDFYKKGNVVRFYIGDITQDYWGDDWNDRPYEHNAGGVYDRYVDNIIDIAFPFDCTVLEPQDDWHYSSNSPWSKEDMKNRKCPCIIVVKPKDEEGWFSDPVFSECMGDENALRIFFGDNIELLDDCESMHITRHCNVINL